MPAVPRLSAFEDYEDATTDRRKDCLGWPMRTMPNSSITPVAETFDGSVVREAIREAQELVPGYTYKGFCAKVAEAGCAGYVVSLLGRRVLYFGRTCETHTEYFPGTQP